MATVDNRSLGLVAAPYNRAYSDLAAWDADCTVVYGDDLIGNDKIWAVEVYYDNDQLVVYNSTLSLAGANSDDTRYKWVRPAAGHGHKDLRGSGALNYDTPGAGFTYNTGTTGMRITLGERGAMFEGLVLNPAITNATTLLLISGENACARDNILRSRNSAIANSPIVTVGASSVSGQKFISNLLIMEGAVGDVAVDLNAGNSGGTRTAYVLANTIVRPSDAAVGGTAFRRNAGGRQVVADNAVFGFDTLVSGSNGTIYTGSGYNATDQADGGTTATQLPHESGQNGTNQYGLTFANQFMGITGAGGDWRTKAGNGLKVGVRLTAPPNPAFSGVGATLRNGTGDVDMLDNARPTSGPVTIGAVEHQSSTQAVAGSGAAQATAQASLTTGKPLTGSAAAQAAAQGSLGSTARLIITLTDEIDLNLPGLSALRYSVVTGTQANALGTVMVSGTAEVTDAQAVLSIDVPNGTPGQNVGLVLDTASGRRLWSVETLQ